MKPGVPFDVVLNRDSKRKIASSVAWKGEERLFGADAVNIVRCFSFLATRELARRPRPIWALLLRFRLHMSLHAYLLIRGH